MKCTHIAILYIIYFIFTAFILCSISILGQTYQLATLQPEHYSINRKVTPPGFKAVQLTWMQSAKVPSTVRELGSPLNYYTISNKPTSNLNNPSDTQSYQLSWQRKVCGPKVVVVVVLRLSLWKSDFVTSPSSLITLSFTANQPITL